MMANSVIVDGWNFFPPGVVKVPHGWIVAAKYLKHDYHIIQSVDMKTFILKVDDKVLKTVSNGHFGDLLGECHED